MEIETFQAMTVETQPQPVSAVEALIHINNQLNQHEVLYLILVYIVQLHLMQVMILGERITPPCEVLEIRSTPLMSWWAKNCSFVFVAGCYGDFDVRSAEFEGGA